MICALTPDVTYCWAQLHPTRNVLYVTSDRSGDFLSLHEYDFKGNWRELTPHLGWDVEEASLSNDGARIAFTVNEEGYSKLHV